MAEREYSKYQQKVIRRFYENRDQIDETRLAELVTSLYLETSSKKVQKLWDSAKAAMERLGVPESRIDHIMEGKDAAILATVVEDLQKGRIKKEKPQKKKPADE